jgi:GR25 family glycosyltransferase involved in LPS biosynthesis
MIDMNTFFDKIFYVNLAKDIDRNEHMISQFKEFGITNYERVDADTYPSIPDKVLWRNFIKDNDKYVLNQLGCRQSHLKAIQIGKNRGYKRILVFEDDVIFLNDPSEILRMNTRTIEVADMFYFGGLIEPHFRNQLVEAHAYCVTDKIMDDILQMAVPSGMEIDNFYAKIIQHMSYNYNQRGQYDVMMLQPFNTIVQNKQFESNIA